jgi:hypothetical protein
MERMAREPLTTLDSIGAALAGFTSLGLLAFPIAGRSFATMFEDFGSRVQLPLLTRLATSIWFPPTLGVLVAAWVVAGIVGRLPMSQRRGCIVGAFIGGCVGIALCLIGAYLPIFELAQRPCSTCRCWIATKPRRSVFCAAGAGRPTWSTPVSADRS